MNPETPQEIFEYKRQWLPKSYNVEVHSDLDVKCKDWCRKNCERHQWSMDTYTTVYGHTFFFEHNLHAIKFANEFRDWIIDNEPVYPGSDCQV